MQDVSADFGEARALVFIGPSGGGKSTLLRILAGLETPDSGRVIFDGKPVDYSSEEKLREHRRHLGVVFQAFNLFPHLTDLAFKSNKTFETTNRNVEKKNIRT